jgi:hypothetical protein
MKFRVIGRPQKKEEVRSHFFTFLDQLEKDDVHEVKFTFGFAWGNFVYDGDWKEELATPAEVRRRVLDAEREGRGRIGDDDFYISVPGVGYERTYCHEADIHFESEIDHPELKAAKESWTKLGWSVYE